MFGKDRFHTGRAVSHKFRVQSHFRLVTRSACSGGESANAHANSGLRGIEA